MGAGSGPGPAEEGQGTNGRRARAPDGWMAVPGPAPWAVSYLPDPRHPLHPYQAQLRREPRLRAWLDDNEALQAFIRAHREPWQRQLTAFRAQPTAGPIDSPMADARIKFVLRVGDELERAAERLSPPDVLPLMTWHYLVEQLIPAEFASKQLAPPSPVQLVADPSGTISMVFTGASQNERRLWEPLIQEAQRFFGHRKDAGGRPSRRDDEEKATHARHAAKLHHWAGWAYLEIADLFGWSGDRSTVEERVRRAVRTGEDLLSTDDELGRGWKLQPPARVAERG